MMRIYCQSISPRNNDVKEKDSKKRFKEERKPALAKTITRRQTLQNFNDIKDMKNSDTKRQPQHSTSNSPIKETQEQHEVDSTTKDAADGAEEEEVYSEDFENDFKKANKSHQQLKKIITDVDLKLQFEQCKK